MLSGERKRNDENGKINQKRFIELFTSNDEFRNDFLRKSHISQKNINFAKDRLALNLL